MIFNALIDIKHEKMSESLYDEESKHPYAVCRICGMEIYKFGKGTYAMNSHARKHVREGKAKESHTQSMRCNDGYDVHFEVK